MYFASMCPPKQENMEKLVFQKQLARNDAFKNALDRNSQKTYPNLSDLPREQLEQLAACHNLCSFTFMYSWSPTSLLVKWLTARGEELIQDDLLLLEEGGEEYVDRLTPREVVDACLRRGILTPGEYAKVVLQTGAEEDEMEPEQGTDVLNEVDTTEADIAELLSSNWDVDHLRKRLRQWMRLVSSEDGIFTSDQNLSIYIHASALGMIGSRQ